MNDLWTKPNPEGKGRVRTDRWGRGRRWIAIWDEGGKRRSKTFELKDAAEDHLSRVRVDTIDGTHITREKASVTLEQMWAVWIAAKADLDPDTVASYRGAWAKIEPVFGHRTCRSLTGPELAAWIPSVTTTKGCPEGQTRPAGSSLKRKIGIVLRGVLETAVESQVIHKNPMKAKWVPKQESSDRRFLSIAEIDQLLENCGQPQDRDLVEVLLFTGIRPGEAAALDCSDLDVHRRRMRIRESKNGEPRDVPIGGELLERLATTAGRREGPLLLAPRGGRWTPTSLRRCWERVGLDGLDMYELRHTAASLAIHAGANVKTVQAMLGHKSAAITLDVYGHLWNDDLDAVPLAVQRHLEQERQRQHAR